MLLVMFDIDGTLVQWNDIDRICYSEAVEEALGIERIDTNWAHYTHVTDSGITSEIIEKHLSRKPQARDFGDVRAAYVRRLQLAVTNDTACFQAVPGASELINSLCSEENTGVCLATGGWRASALLKLKTAGIAIENIPLASADDSYERAGIMTQALERAITHKNCRAFNSVVYVGDAVWDFMNSEKMGYGFVGIGSGDNERELRQAGVTHIQPNFLDKEYFFSVLGVRNSTE